MTNIVIRNTILTVRCVLTCVNRFIVVKMFFIRVKLNNIFRSISFEESEINSFLGDNQKFIFAVIEKGWIPFELHKKSTEKIIFLLVSF